jgi:hypothetical protein
MFRSNWSSSGVQVIMVKGSAAHCDTVTFPPIAVASGLILVMWVNISCIWVSLGCAWLLLVMFGTLVVATLNILARAGVLLYVGRPS